jgi:hypothetical protein
MFVILPSIGSALHRPLESVPVCLPYSWSAGQPDESVELDKKIRASSSMVAKRVPKSDGVINSRAVMTHEVVGQITHKIEGKEFGYPYWLIFDEALPQSRCSSIAFRGMAIAVVGN